MPDPEKRKKKLWEIDPSVYAPGPKAGLRQRVVEWFREVGKAMLYVAFFAYPLALPNIRRLGCCNLGHPREIRVR
jgi:hypothetical protein